MLAFFSKVDGIEKKNRNKVMEGREEAGELGKKKTKDKLAIGISWKY